MEEIFLTARPRTVIGKQVNAMRRAGTIPAVLYGKHLDKPLTLQIEEKTLQGVVAQAGHNRLIRLTIDSGAPRLVLTREVQRNPISGRIVHVDLQEVLMTEKITTGVPLILVGTSPAVTRGEGLLIHGIDTVQINTGTACHLDARMVRFALKDVNLTDYELVFIENVGNLICPVEFALGEHRRVVLFSLP